MRIWDRGTYELHKFRDDEVMVTFHGERLQGRYVLFRTGGKNWMIHRMDPPRGPGAGADAGEARADARPHRAAPARGRPLGVRDQVGRRAGDRLRGRAGGCGWRAATATTSRRATPSCASSAGRSARARRSSTARWWRSGPTASRASSGSRAACTWPRRARSPAARAHANPVAYVIFDLLYLDGHSLMEARLRRAPRAAARARPQRADLADAGAPRRRRRGAARGHPRAGPGGHHRQAARLPVHAGPPLARAGSRSRTSAARRPSSAAGCRAREAAPAGSARSSSATTTTTARCATPAASARASTTASSTASGELLAERERGDSARSQGRQPPKLTRFVEPDLVARRRLLRVDAGQHAPPALLQGPAGRHPTHGRARPRRLVTLSRQTRVDPFTQRAPRSRPCKSTGRLLQAEREAIDRSATCGWRSSPRVSTAW